jgi:hypothetical protein
LSLGYFNTLDDVELATKTVRKSPRQWNPLRTRELPLA